jgi:hypothetical protein
VPASDTKTELPVMYASPVPIVRVTEPDDGLIMAEELEDK